MEPANDPAQKSGDGLEAASGPETPSSRAPSSWREIWPLPLLLLAGGLLVGGGVMAFMTRPAPVFTPVLDDASRLIEADRYEEAIGLLNDRVFPYLDRPELSRAAEVRYHTLLARALYGGQRELEFPQRVNDENIVRQYVEAEEHGADLAQDDLLALGRTHVALDELDRAVERARQIESLEARAEIYREVIDAGRLRPRPDHEMLLMVVEEMLATAGIPEADRVWALARRAEMQLGLGFISEAINGLLREMPMLVGRDVPGVGALFMMLGRAYYQAGAYREANEELERADDDDLLADADPARVWARLYLAHVEAKLAEDEADLRAARDRYADITRRFSRSPAYLPALLGLAETEAGLGDHDAALEAYGALAAEFSRGEHISSPTRAEVTESLLARSAERDAAWRAGGPPHLVEQSLRYAEISGDLYQLEDTPPEVLAALSRAHEASAHTVLGLGPDAGGEKLSLSDLRSIDPGTMQQAKRHLIRAASYAHLHADRFIIDDYETFADSLWRSAMLSDAAGDRDQAIATLTEFVKSVRDDARRPEAKFLLGQMFQARGEYVVAAGHYLDLIEEQRASPNPGTGQWADRSYVPLAQCYIQDVDESNDADALRLLRSAVDGTRGGPERPEFRQAVLELGNLAFRAGRYADAAERYKEALAREGGETDSIMTRYRLADAYRLLAAEISQRLDEPMSDRDASLLAGERKAHLQAAIDLFTRVRDELSRRDPRTLTELERMVLRNTHFYLGDCAFDLGSYEEAIEYYNMAQSRYPEDPAVLVALIQIVNAYVELGDLRTARTANERARTFYKSLPADVWDDPDLPLGRQEWERWLDSNAKLYEGLAQGG